MAIDWKKEFDSWKRIYFWYIRAGLIAIPFGVVYACINLRLGHEPSKTVVVIVLAAAMLTIYKIQGFPPDK